MLKSKESNRKSNTRQNSADFFNQQNNPFRRADKWPGFEFKFWVQEGIELGISFVI
jgi:hypothetical protein